MGIEFTIPVPWEQTAEILRRAAQLSGISVQTGYYRPGEMRLSYLSWSAQCAWLPDPQAPDWRTIVNIDDPLYGRSATRHWDNFIDTCKRLTQAATFHPEEPTEPPTSAVDGAGRLESAASINDILRRIDDIHLDLGEKLDDLKRGQVIIYQHIDAEDQSALRAILKGIQQQRVEQGEMQNALDAIRRVLKHIQKTGLPVADDAIEQSLADIYQAVSSDMGFRQQLELSLPVIPLLLKYKIGLDAGVDLGAVWKELIKRVQKGQNGQLDRGTGQ